MAKKPTPYDENGRFNGMRATIESAIGPIVDPVWGRHKPERLCTIPHCTDRAVWTADSEDGSHIGRCARHLPGRR